MELKIRQEISADYSSVYKLVKEAFEQAEHTDGTEQDLVERLRKDDAFIPELSLVAELDGKIVGHIMFTKTKVGDHIELTLAPLSVAVGLQGQGIGGQLIRAGHEIAAKMGYEFSILVGHAGYYPRFGYKPAASFGIKCPMEVPEENFMACSLLGRDAKLDGTVEYPKAFGI